MHINLFFLELYFLSDRAKYNEILFDLMHGKNADATSTVSCVVVSSLLWLVSNEINKKHDMVKKALLLLDF
jgi:hypothetical protein